MGSLLVLAMLFLREPIDLEDVKEGTSWTALIARFGLPTAKLGDEWAWINRREAIFVTFGRDYKVSASYMMPVLGQRAAFEVESGIHILRLSCARVVFGTALLRRLLPWSQSPRRGLVEAPQIPRF